MAHKNVPAVKIQMAFFEALGADGFYALRKIIKEAKTKGLITILDAKRGDISSTMEAYGNMSFDYMNACALTITPYMGIDVLKPLVKWMLKNKGVYCVFYSSNPSGYKIQNTLVNNKTIAEYFLYDFDSYLKDINMQKNFGIVVASHCCQEKNRGSSEILNEYPHLIPGVGAQGGKIDKNLKTRVKLEKPHLLAISRSLVGFGDKKLAKDLDKIETLNEYQIFVYNRIKLFTEELC